MLANTVLQREPEDYRRSNLGSEIATAVRMWCTSVRDRSWSSRACMLRVACDRSTSIVARANEQCRPTAEKARKRLRFKRASSWGTAHQRGESSFSAPRLGWQWSFAWPPDTECRLHAPDIIEVERDGWLGSERDAVRHTGIGITNLESGAAATPCPWLPAPNPGIARHISPHFWAGPATADALRELRCLTPTPSA